VIDFDSGALERVLPDTPGPADWDEVLGRSRVRQRRRRRYIAVLSVVALAIVGTASAVGVRTFVLDTGPTSLPPEGAMPSTPESGELVVYYYGRPELSGFPTFFVPVNAVYVYADGRVISRREGGAFGVYEPGTGEVRTGFLERRLTPEGVELLRSEIVSTGLFDRDRYVVGSHGLKWGEIHVRNGDRLVEVAWCCRQGTPDTEPTPEQALALSRLTELLSDLPSWLPAGAWEDVEPRAYVPVSYAACFWRWREDWRPPDGSSELLEPSRVLHLLPAAAQDILRGRDVTHSRLAYYENDVPLWRWVCSEVTTEGAHALDGIFGEAGFEREPRFNEDEPDDPAGNLRFQAPGPNGIVIAFEPMLPHGEWEVGGG
jgi:hypothetical protein